MRPGKGWKHLGGAVWEYSNGTRVHLLGSVRLPDGTTTSKFRHPEANRLWQLTRINGGNFKRGLMAWARELSAGYPAKTLPDPDAGCPQLAASPARHTAMPPA